MTPTTAKGRAAIAGKLAEIVRRYDGATVEIVTEWPSAPSRETMVKIEFGDARVNIAVAPDCVQGWVVPWYIDWQSNARFSDAFAGPVGAEVNPFHRRKCMGVYFDMETMLARVEAAMDCIADGRALMGEAK